MAAFRRTARAAALPMGFTAGAVRAEEHTTGRAAGRGDVRGGRRAVGGHRRGVGEALVRVCVERAGAVDGRARPELSAQAAMRPARRLHERPGFVRTPGCNRTPIPGVTLLTYALEL
ncbi:hypothetical protein ACLGI4_09245 [Streptomyces sp. HMX112]|uniref:hypothetical protein n=1 Tax=Streptomyces sp. HMX112 TaxID=3390850 RepID=UPI003A80FE47